MIEQLPVGVIAIAIAWTLGLIYYYDTRGIFMDVVVLGVIQPLWWMTTTIIRPFLTLKTLIIIGILFGYRHKLRSWNQTYNISGFCVGFSYWLATSILAFGLSVGRSHQHSHFPSPMASDVSAPAASSPGFQIAVSAPSGTDGTSCNNHTSVTSLPASACTTANSDNGQQTRQPDQQPPFITRKLTPEMLADIRRKHFIECQRQEQEEEEAAARAREACPKIASPSSPPSNSSQPAIPSTPKAGEPFRIQVPSCESTPSISATASSSITTSPILATISSARVYKDSACQVAMDTFTQIQTPEPSTRNETAPNEVIRSLESDKGKLEDRNQELSQEVKALKEALDEMKKEKDQLAASCETKQTQVYKHEGTISGLRADLKKRDEFAAAQRAEVSSLEAKLAKADTQAKMDKGRLKDLRGRLAARLQDVEELKEKLANASVAPAGEEGSEDQSAASSVVRTAPAPAPAPEPAQAPAPAPAPIPVSVPTAVTSASNVGGSGDPYAMEERAVADQATLSRRPMAAMPKRRARATPSTHAA